MVHESIKINKEWNILVCVIKRQVGQIEIGSDQFEKLMENCHQRSLCLSNTTWKKIKQGVKQKLARSFHTILILQKQGFYTHTERKKIRK